VLQHREPAERLGTKLQYAVMEDHGGREEGGEGGREEEGEAGREGRGRKGRGGGRGGGEGGRTSRERSHYEPGYSSYSQLRKPRFRREQSHMTL